MKKIFWSIIFFGCIGSTTLNAQETIVLSEGKNHPLICITKNILTEAYHRIGIKIESMVLPGPRSLTMANGGSIDGVLFRGAVNKNDFPNLIKIPVALTYGEIVVFTKNVEFEVNGWKSLRAYDIGIQRSVNELETGTLGMKVEVITESKQLFNMLIHDRVDIVVLPRDVGLTTLSTMNLEGIKILGPPLQKDAIYHYLHKKNKSLVPKITVALQEMEKEGLIQAFNKIAKTD